MNQGDIAILGRHRLLCGDAFNPEHVDLLMVGEKANMLYCDPPYGIKLDTSNRQMRVRPGRSIHSLRRDSGISHAHYEPVRGDDTNFDPRPIIERFDHCREQFWWGGDYYAESLPARNQGCFIVWDKRLTERMDRAFGSCFELCWSRHKHKREMARVLWSGLMGWWNDVGTGKRVHPTQKPVALCEWFLERYSKPDAIVVDLFAGSGSTLLACERMSRRARVAEIDPHYCQVIIDRWEKMTGQQAVIASEQVAA